ncbi:unnamed protein product, partial [Closterium sp. Naga37s-1]
FVRDCAGSEGPHIHDQGLHGTYEGQQGAPGTRHHCAEEGGQHCHESGQREAGRDVQEESCISGREAHWIRSQAQVCC